MSRRMKAEIRTRNRDTVREKELARVQKYEEACDAQRTECFHEGGGGQVMFADDPPAEDREVPMFQAFCALTMRHFKRWTRDALVVVLVGGVFNALLNAFYGSFEALEARP